jgi:amino acid adenylation domain-containing protein/non-ribosomal peptide synthase protein (TIGR01720 family)
VTPVLQLLRAAADAGVRLTLEGGRLRVRGPEGSLTPELKAAIAAQRDALISLLSEDDAPADARITARPALEVAPLSSGQRRLWLLQQLTPDSTIFNLTAGWQLEGDLNIAALQAALDALVQRHEILRTTFVDHGDGPVQRIAQSASLPLSITEDVRDFSEAMTAEMSRPFDLAADLPLRVMVARKTAHHHALIVTMHHIASDHASIVLFAQELSAAYRAGVAGEQYRAPALPFQFGDYAAWERESRAHDANPSHLEYWKRQLSGAPRLLELPTDRPRPAVSSADGGGFTFDIGADRVAPLLALGAAHGLTPFMTLLGVYALLLVRYSGQQDVCIGGPVSTRRAAGSDQVIGFFVDTQVLRIDVDGHPTVAEFFERVRRVVVDALAHPLPFDRLVDAVAAERSMSQTPVFQVMLVLQTEGLPALRLPGLTDRRIAPTATMSEFDITLFLEQRGQALTGHVEFRADLFDAATIEQMCRHFCELVDEVGRDASAPVDRLAFSSGAQYNPAEPYTFTSAVHERIAERAQAQPSAPAIAGDNGVISYADLNRRANQLAWRLIDAGAALCDRIGLRVGSTRDFTVGVLAILRAGCAYVPLSGHLPDLRAREIVTANQIALIVDADLIALSASEPRHNAPARTVRADDLAAVYHTSGSTGVPMGVMFTHRGLASHAEAIQDRYALGPADRVLQFAAWDFDVAAEEVLPTLCSGAAIVERPDPELSFADFEAHLSRYAVTVLNLPASYWEAWVHHENGPHPRTLDAIRLLIAGSERVTAAAMSRWFDVTGGRIRTLNAYGTTEATITTTIFEASAASVMPRAVVPVGLPLRYSAVYVLDAHGRRLPPLVAGEIWIGGAGVTGGYVNAPAATAVRFAPDPFAHDSSARMVRTGDRGRLLADGTLDVLGRLDRQIKLRGFRIDPRDIEAALTAHPSVEQCATVLARRQGVPDRLIAYARLTSAATPVEELRDFVASRLPAYMVPAAIIAVDALPLTSRGKIDLAALEARPIEGAEPTGAIAPRTGAEAILAVIWAELLGVPSVSVTDNFFALGGDSILSIAMISRARSRGLQLKPHSLFEHQTIEALARSAAPAVVSVQPDTAAGPIPLSPIQQRFLNEDASARSRYSQAIRLTLPADVDEHALVRAFQAIVDHHAALRYRFEESATGWTQIAGGASTVRLDSIALDALDLAQEAALVTSLEGRLNPTAGALVQGAVVRYPQSRALLLVIHHLVVDAVSFSFILEDLQQAYHLLAAGAPLSLPATTTPFSVFAQRLAMTPVEEHDVDTWAEQDDDRSDWHSRGDATGDAVAMSTILDESATADLLKWAPELFSASMPDAVMAAVVQGFQVAGGGGRLRLDIEGHGRDLPLPDLDLTRTVGWFTTIHPLLIETAPDAAIADRIAHIRDARRSTPPAYTYDLARFITPNPDTRARLEAAGNAPVLFNYLGVWRHHETSGSWAALPVTSANQASAHRSHAIEINAVVSGGRLQVHWTCGDGLEARVRSWSAAAHRALESLAAECRRIGSALGDDVEDVLPLTPLQLGILSHTLRDASGRSYLDLLTVTVEGELDVSAFRQAWESVLSRHPALRTSFAYRDVPVPMQVIRRHVTLDWQVEDLRALGAEARSARLDAITRGELDTGMDLGCAPLMRLRLARIADQQQVLIWTTSHLILDGWSTGIVFRELFAIYDAVRHGRVPNLPAPASFAQLVRSFDRGVRESRAYWRASLSDLAAPTPIPLGRNSGDERAASSTHDARRVTLDETMSSRLRALAREAHISLSTVFQAAWALINRREHDQETVVFGLTVSGRSGEIDGIESMVGALINAVPAVVTVADDLAVIEWLRQLHAQHLSRERFSNIGLTTLQKLSSIPPGTELFESLLLVQNYPVDDSSGPSGLRLRDLQTEEATHYPLTVVIDPGDRIVLGISYRLDRLTDEAAGQLLQQFTAVLSGMVDAPSAPVRSLNLMSSGERRALLQDWSATGEIAVEPLVFVRQFEAQAARTPDAIALVHGDRRWTYAELDADANRWAHGLIAFGCGPGAIVGVCLERSPEHILSVLAIFKSGGAFLPLDPAHPPARLDMMITDAGVAVLITSSSILNELPAVALLTICVDEQSPGEGQPDSAPPETLDPDALAYVIYTSGSTGTPKGVMGLHRGLGSLAANQRQLFGLGATDRVLQFAPIGFDASLWEIAMALGSGAALVLATRDTLMPGPPLERLLRDERITAVTLPPSSLAALEPGSYPDLHTVIVAGESCPPSLARTWSRDRRMFNAYGPTETAVCATIGQCDGGDDTPHIGRPLANFRVHLLDADLQPVPRGGAGEICVAGWGLAGGYLGREELTRERFAGNPHAGVAYPAAGYERLYRTGDLGRYRADGSIEFIGRRDGQVKVRGFRIELGEIEAALSEHRDLRQCCVVARDDGGGKHLVAYTVPREDAPPVDQLRAFLRERLPDYMVPTQFVSLAELPVTANGKIARQLLPAPGTASLGIDERYVAPRTPVETSLSDIWASVLRLPRVGIHDNFFEIGGDSILAIQIVSRCNQAGVAVSIADLFDHRYQTISALGERAGVAPAANIESDAAAGLFALTPVQQWFFAQALPAQHHYNQTLLFEVPADLDRRALDAALGSLRRHHDALRLRFVETDAGWQQEYLPETGRAMLDVVTLAGRSEEEKRRAIESEAARQQTLFDLTEGRVFRAVLLTFDDGGSQRLWISAHHLVVDGVSWNILLGDLVHAYAAIIDGHSPVLPSRTTSYRGWTGRLHAHATSDGVVEEIPFWKQVEAKTNTIPVDTGDRRVNPSAAAQRFTSTIDAELSNAVLREVPRVYHTQINDVLLTAVAQAFRQWTGQSRLTVNLEGHGREPIGDVDVTRTVGWCTSIFPVVLDTGDDGNIGAQLLATMAALRAIPNRGIGYGVLRYLNAESGLGVGSAPEVSFNYLGQAGQIEAPAAWLRMAKETVDSDFSRLGNRPHLIDVNAIHLNDRLQFDWIYNSELHRESTIRALATGVEHTLRAIVEHCRATGALLPVTSMQEQILQHSVAHPDSLAYRVELACELTGTLDGDRFRDCWQQAVDRHAALRSEFSRLADGSFRQRFADRMILPWDGAEGPVLGGPLASAQLEFVGNDTHRFTFRHHHLLLDGWSVSKVFGEVLARYHGRRIDAANDSAESYLQWLAQRDAAADLAFWRSELEGFKGATPRDTVEGQAASDSVILGAELSSNLRAFAASRHVTLNTVLFGAWAITLASLRDTSDVAIGTVFSGRHAPLAGIEDMVGMLINTLPVRVAVDSSLPMDAWLSGLQRKLALTMQHSATRLSEIESSCGFPEGVFDTTFRFQNYPIDPAMVDGGDGLRISGVAIRDVWHHPLNISVIPGDDIQVIADYFPSVHGADAIALALAVFSGVAAQVLNAGADSPAALLDTQFGGVLG